MKKISSSFSRLANTEIEKRSDRVSINQFYQKLMLSLRI